MIIGFIFFYDDFYYGRIWDLLDFVYGSHTAEDRRRRWEEFINKPINISDLFK